MDANSAHRHCSGVRPMTCRVVYTCMYADGACGTVCTLPFAKMTVLGLTIDAVDQDIKLQTPLKKCLLLSKHNYL